MGVPLTMNNKLGLEIPSKLKGNSKERPALRGSVIAAFILFPEHLNRSMNSELYHIVLVTSSKAELFCLLTGDHRKVSFTPSAQILSAVHFPQSLMGNIIAICESSGHIRLLEAYSLVQQSILSDNNDLPIHYQRTQQVTGMTKGFPDMMYTGHANGSVKVWNLNVPECLYIWSEENIPGVRSIGYFEKFRLVIAGFHNSYESESRLVMIEDNPLRAYKYEGPEITKSCEKLEGFKGTCLNLTCIDKFNFVAAVSSELNQVYIWDVITYYLVFKFTVPTTIPKMMALSVCSIENTNVLALGMTTGLVIISSLEFENSEVMWRPLKEIQISEHVEIDHISHSGEIDVLLIGDAQACLYIVSNLTENLQLVAESQEESKNN